MKARRFEEILEECVSAHLAGRRSIQESLSLYPSLAPELEPVLRTATGVAASFSDYSPPQYVFERGRHRFLTAASTRRRARALTSRIDGSERRSRPWAPHLWGFVAAAAAAVVVAAIVGGLVLLGGRGGSDDAVRNQTPVPTPGAVLNLNDIMAAHQRLKDAVTKGTSLTEPIAEVQQQTESLLSVDPSTLPAAYRAEASKAIADQYNLLQSIQPSAPQQAQVANVLGMTRDLMSQWGIGAFTPSATTTPAPTLPPATPAPTLPPTPTPAPTPAPTQQPTPAPTPGGQPTPTPPIYQPS